MPTTLWKPGRYDVANLPLGQSASLFEVAQGWNIARFVNGIEFRQYRSHRLPEDALSDLQLQVDEELANWHERSRDELQRFMKRYRFTT